jgi:hypothetical protein
MIVVITIHGIGTQEAPSALTASDGYADALHEGLRQYLGAALGDDPNRLAAGGHGPVYAQSEYPPQTHATEAGLSRLGRWNADGGVDIKGADLAPEGKRVAHVALIYSGLEGQASDPSALRVLDVLAIPELTSYATLDGLAKMAFRDLEALRQHPGDPSPLPPGLPPPANPPQHRGLMERLLHLHKDADALTPKGENQPGGLGVLRTIEDDVAAYVTSNEHRERVRMFLRDAASRLIGRTDVEGVIVNGHSTGTVMGFDLIAALSPPSARGVRALITTGSPLRKYSDLLNWGQDAGNMRDMSGSWTNFWDPRDPVADPLGPLSDWKRGEPIPEGGGPGMFVVHDPDTGAESSMAVTDVQVDNVNHSSGGGLRAHNYWDNDQFCSAAAKLIAAIRGAPEVAAG